jgi:Holliday junction resolvase RusA-like endonuclease
MTNPSEHDISFYIEGEPVPKQSFRMLEKRSGKTHGYADPKVTSWQKTIGTYANQYFPEKLIGKLKVTLRFFLSNNRVIDLDNLTKGVLDGLKGIAFKDDCQVFEMYLSKSVDKDNPGVYIEVGKLDEYRCAYSDPDKRIGIDGKEPEWKK